MKNASFSAKTKLSNYSLKETLSNEGNWKALLFSLKAILLKRNSLPGCRALRKTTIFLFFFYIFEFLFYENSTWMISCLSLDHSKFYKTLLRDFFYNYLKLFENSGMIFLALLGLNIQKYCQHFVRWSNLSKRLGGNKILNWFFLFRFIPQDGVSGQIISKTWSSIV